MGRENHGERNADAWLRSRRPAPWGIVCLALLIQRSSDKSAVVRAKAIAHLGTVISDAVAAGAEEGGAPLAFRRVRPSSEKVKMCTRFTAPA